MNKKKKIESLNADSFRPVAPSSKEDNDKPQVFDASKDVMNSSSGSLWNKLGRRWSMFLIAGLLVIVSVPVVIFLATSSKRQELKTQEANVAAQIEIQRVNESVLKGDDAKAIYHAKEALKASPNNPDAIVLVADLIVKDDPKEAKRLYGRALDIYKDTNNLSDGNVSTIENWAAATLAEDAGKTEEALKYYDAVIANGNEADSYESDLMRQSSEAIARLRK